MLTLFLQEAAAAGRPFTIPWSRAVLEYIGFLAYFFVFGALGFRYIVLAPLERHFTRSGTADAMTLRAVHDVGLRGAARIGIIGTILFLITLANSLLGDAAKHKLPAMSMLGQESKMFYAQLAFIVIALICFVVALGRVGAVWAIAALAALCLAFRNIVTGRWTTLVNPVHIVTASLWLGTLLVLVAAGLPAIFQRDVVPDRRGPVTAELITRFSPLAIVGASLLGISGVTTAWLHLHVLSNLWSTPYGITLIVKLCFVAIVLGMGAWNWKRMTPALGQETAAFAMRRSATTELVFGAIVLAVTAVLVSIPSPRRPGAGGPPGAAPNGPNPPTGRSVPAPGPGAQGGSAPLRFPNG